MLLSGSFVDDSIVVVYGLCVVSSGMSKSRADQLEKSNINSSAGAESYSRLGHVSGMHGFIISVTAGGHMYRICHRSRGPVLFPCW